MAGRLRCILDRTFSTEGTLTYIANQQEHHMKRDFQAEFVAFLKKNNIEFDPRYVWG